MKIIDIKVDIIGDSVDTDPDKGGVEPLAIVRIYTNEGIVGLSESFRVPPGVALAVMNGKDSFLGSRLIGQTLSHPERLWQLLYDSILHYNRRGWITMCIGALDIAVWDIYGKMMQQPIYELLGGIQRSFFQHPASSPTVEAVPYCTIVSEKWDCEDMICSQIERALLLKDLGYRGFKVEPMMSSIENTIALARRAREALGPDVMLAVDVGYRFNDVNSALKVCREIEEYDIYFFETPFPVDSFETYKSLAKRTDIPLAMGEHSVGRSEAVQMIKYGDVSVVQSYISTGGGLTEAKRLVASATDLGAMYIPGNWSTQLLGAATVHLALFSTVTPYYELAPAEIFDSDLRQEIQNLGLPVVNGAVHPPTTPGLGIEIPQSLIDRFRIDG